MKMTLNEAIEHCKKVAKEQENCNRECSLEHRQLAILVADDVKYLLEELALNDRYFILPKKA